jgi:hypothetical protein
VLTGTSEDIEKLEKEIFRMFNDEKNHSSKYGPVKNRDDKIFEYLKKISQ